MAALTVEQKPEALLVHCGLAPLNDPHHSQCYDISNMTTMEKMQS